MPAKDLGTKYTCWKCGTKFYDMNKPSASCPKCGSDPRAAPVVKAPPPTERRRPKEEVEEIEPAEDALEEEVEEPEEAEEPDDEG